ncbi:MAG: hypothetical protein RJA36_3365 [Pseudomonadota bacterium]
MAEEIELHHLIQADTTEHLSPQNDAEAEVAACTAPPLDAESGQTPDSQMADLAGDKLDCMQLMAAPCHAICLPRATPLFSFRTLASHWPEALQRPPCALNA